MVAYADVKAVFAQLIAEGVYPSKTAVRSRLGSGSYETLWPLIQQAKQEFSVAPPTTAEEESPPDSAAVYPWPEPDPARVQRLLADRRGERAVEDVIAHAAGALAHLELMRGALHTAQQWALQRAWALSNGVPSRLEHDTFVRGLTRFVAEAGARFDQLRSFTGQEEENGRPAA